MQLQWILKKAFDSVDWNYLWEALDSFNMV